MDTLFNDPGRSVPNERRPDNPVDPLFVHRWSPRAFDPTPIPENILLTLFEAARWAPSARNEQPWLFLYASDENGLAAYRSALVEFNQTWANTAPVLVYLLARRNTQHNNQPNDWAAFDCGAAWMALAMQARQFGLYSHAMGGFDPDRAYDVLGVDRAEFRIMCAIAIGRYGDPDSLPDEIRAREHPNERKPVTEIAIKA
ncbi:MAG: nitroreductase family protein [candidate division Zixibacteria bacterium]|nr:nitroreductase family protein [candidate division Zixibacteria bacterium]